MNIFLSGPVQSLPPPSTSTGHVAAQQARLDIFHLEEAVSHYLSRALASSTLRTYSSGQRRYLSFCEAASISPLLLSDHTLCMFVAWLARGGLAHQTIKSYLSAIRHFHILAGQGDPFAGEAYPILQYVLRGIKRSPARAARQPVLSVTPSILQTLKRQWRTMPPSNQDYRIYSNSSRTPNSSRPRIVAALRACSKK